MIFVTVGMQLPFDRLIQAMDRLASQLGEEVFAQIGETGFEPANMTWTPFLDGDEFEAKVQEARVIVSHAGVGSILAAQRNAKPLIILPRRAAFYEHRTDHQMHTVSALKGRRGIVPIGHESEIAQALKNAHEIDRSKITAAQASPSLQMALKDIIETKTEPAFSRRLFGFFSK